MKIDLTEYNYIKIRLSHQISDIIMYDHIKLCILTNLFITNHVYLHF